MAKIKGIIPQQNFELVRDRIGMVLADELAQQFFYSSGDTENPKVYTERYVGIDHTELPLITVSLVRGEYDEADVMQDNGVYIYNVDVSTTASFSNAQQGDTASVLSLHRIIGMCRAILKNPAYRTLDFAPPSLQGTRILSIAFEDPSTENDSRSIARGRIVYEVMAPEGVQLLDAPALALSSTTVKLYDTDKGYFWQVDNNENRLYADAAHSTYQADDDKLLKPTT